MLGLMFIGYILTGCAGPGGRTHPVNKQSNSPLKRLNLGMTREEVSRILPLTPCRVKTLYHGHPAQAWGYRSKKTRQGFILRPSDCALADSWIYFEDNHLVGWTPAGQ